MDTMYTSRMFDMWSSVSTKLEAQNQSPAQTNMQTNIAQTPSSGSIKGIFYYMKKHVRAQNYNNEYLKQI